MPVYDNIKTICEKKGISIRALEIEAKLGNGTISKWNNASPNINNLKAVADILKVKIEKLLE